MNDHQFCQLLDYMQFSWQGYRKVRKGVKKRIARHMQKLDCRTMNDYILALNHNQRTKSECTRLLTVSISRFFRDQALWSCLEKTLLPAMVKTFTREMVVWSAGCACGQEVYSLKILWDRMDKNIGPIPKLRIWATDLHPDYLTKAQAGIYSQSNLKEVPEALKGRYFNVWRKDKSWKIIDNLKEGVSWELKDLLSPLPDKEFHLVFLRNNLLTYYEDTIKIPAFEQIVNGLAKGGYLIIGSHENIPSGFSQLRPSGIHPCIFQKENAA